MVQVGDRQRQGEPLAYCKIPIREGTTPKKLIDLLSSSQRLPGQRLAFHIDVGHIIPSSANTMLFQLLLVGVLRDPVSCRVFHRSKDDIFFVEIPNSYKNKTADALNICTLLPTTVMAVNSSTLQLVRPSFVDEPACTEIRCVEYEELTYAAKWLRAMKRNRFKPGTGQYNPQFSPYTDDAITNEECFELLRESCANPAGPSPRPSWSIFYNFVKFIHMQYSNLSQYDVLNILDLDEYTKNLRGSFTRLLLETIKVSCIFNIAQNIFLIFVPP